MDVLMIPFLKLVYSLLTIYYQVVIISFILNLLELFNVVNPHNRFIQIIGTVVSRLTEPLLAKIRSVLPSLGGIDFSPMVLLLGVGYLKDAVTQLMLKLAF